VGAGRSGTCTLLGPEGPDDPAPFSGVGVMVSSGLHRDRDDRWVWGFWPSVENYIVDASILETGLRSCFTKGESPSASFRGCCLACSLVNFAASLFGVVLHDSISCDFQVFKSKRWMPWHLEPKKDVVICDKPRGADKRAVIRGFPNGETPPGPSW
jgi:hypothetical protein